MYYLLYNLIPLPRDFGYLDIVLGSVTTATFQHCNSFLPFGIQLPSSSSVTSGTRNHSSTVVIIPGTATCCTRGHGSHNTGYSYMLHEGPLSHGSHNTGFSYMLHEGLLPTVIIIPVSVTSEGLAVRHHVLLYFPLINKILI